MNYLTDSKNLVRNSYLDSNKYLFTDRGTSSVGADKTAFSKALAQAQAQNGVNTSSNSNSNTASNLTTNPSSPSASSISIRSGDTLSNIVRGYFAAQGQTVSPTDAMHLSQELARSNGIQNPDKIFPGQQLNLSALSAATPGGPGVDSTANYINARAASMTAQANPNQTAYSRPAQWSVAGSNVQGTSASTRIQSGSSIDAGDNPILNKTLDRAVEKGFIPAQEKTAVYDKIVNMSKTYQFHPDDFARLTLMESDGMNPKATNNRCHGIIQFCEGPDRGAASAGFATNAKDITNRSVLQQLDMVTKYFDETGLKNFGPASLDDLYLTVLTPAARSETRTHANLNIAGSQASMLHVNRDTSAPITRHSIIEGLHQNAINRLGLDLSTTTVAQAPSSSLAANTTNNSGTGNLNSLSAQNTLTSAGLNTNSSASTNAQAIQMMQATLLAQANQMGQGGQTPTSALGRAQNVQFQQAQFNMSGSNPLMSPMAAQLAQVTQMAQANTNAQTSQTSPASQAQPSNTNRAQALRVSAYLNQTYLP